MEFRFQIGTKAYFGKNCVKLNKSEFSKYGKKALIVCGKTSARASGALDDVLSVLEESDIGYDIFDKVENNPSLENVKEGGRFASECGADFVIGIGGGSPLDASKAIAVLAVNDIKPVELYKNSFAEKPLPVLAIPTTSGSGSEVTPYSILTRRDMQTKMSFGNEDTFPKVAFLDARYTESMSRDTAINTAVDAFAHAVEGYVSKRSTVLSDIFAVEAISLFGRCVNALINDRMDFDTREKLLYASMLGGMVISHTGTTSVHGMGYSLTYFKGIPHGRANGLLLEQYLKFCFDAAKEKIDNILKLLNLKLLDDFGMMMSELLQCGENFEERELELYAGLAMKQKSASYNIKSVTQRDLFEILRKSLIK